MAEEKEAAFPINAFAGVNRNSNREELAPNQFYQLQNLWERKLGTLETRNGSTLVTSSFQSAITGLDNVQKIYKPVGTNPRFTVGQVSVPACTIATPGTFPTNVSLSWVTDATAYWGPTQTFGGVDYGFLHQYVVLRMIGPGKEKIYRLGPTTDISGYSGGARQKLRLTVSGAVESGFTGIEILAAVNCGVNNTFATPATSGGNYNYRHMWVGFVDVNGVTSSTTDFKYTPFGNALTMAHPSTYADTSGAAVSFTTLGINSASGSLTAGKTYYVMVLPQFLRVGTDPRCAYLHKKVNTNTQVTAITIPSGTYSTGQIVVTMNASFSALCYLVCIGEHPQLLQPWNIYNESLVNTQVTINSIPAGNPGVIVANRTNSNATATLSDLAFNFSNFSKYDCLIKVSDAGALSPIFTGNMYSLMGGEWDTWYDQFGITTADTGAGRQYAIEIANTLGLTMESMGIANKYQFVPWQGLSLFVNDKKDVANYYVTDGNVAAPVVMDFQSTTTSARQTLPNAKYIGLFQGSVIIGGGTPGVDPNNGGKLDSSRKFFISRANNFSDFTIAGASAPVLNYLNVDSGEDINGFGSFTNTQNQLGPLSQGLITNKNGIWVIDDLPTFDSSGVISNLSSVNLRQLSKRVGCAGQNTICYTPVGTIITSNIGVWIIREGGEPTPVGECLLDILREADLSAASACYHDNHYKLSFYHADYDNSGVPDAVRRQFPTVNNCEFWLNVTKLIETKKEDWVGPMVGRSINYSFVEDRDKDGLTYSIARDRYCTAVAVATGIFKADVEPSLTATVVNDFSTPVTAIIETSELVTPQDSNWNKLIKRWYWKLRTNLLVGSPLSFTDKTYINGVLAETQTVTTYTSITDSFKNLPFTSVRVFPQSRLRGRTLRKYFSTASRVSVNGFQLNYEVERRRI